MRRRYNKSKSKGIGEMTVMEVGKVEEVAVKMTASAEREVLEVADHAKKRKMCDGDLEMSPTVACVRSHSEDILVAQESLVTPTSELSSPKENAALSSNFDDALASCCASNGSSKSLDLEEETVEIATSKSKESSIKAELRQMEPTTRAHHPKSRRRLTAEKMPSETDLEEFFAAAEKDILKRFTKKYNFDFVKEDPLEGHYEWVRSTVKP
ncbi:PREDICTED: cyclin-dependent kinase inhibitor 7-like isoform X2 [Nicotiana attenuata]|uniref:cyclin-dependent kinase inhibitor 7-like isoform X2 n=1 Tax=Nicotiana attenuata TaxID=49451 RepID=UPI000904CEBB|nr:PREDICTED: cyclin-dependent kinase inhibitor 7-like isoform X2 [Nicotiana attenuata]